MNSTGHARRSLSARIKLAVFAVVAASAAGFGLLAEQAAHSTAEAANTGTSGGGSSSASNGTTSAGSGGTASSGGTSIGGGGTSSSSGADTSGGGFSISGGDTNQQSNGGSHGS